MEKAKDTSHIDWNDWFYYDETSPSCLRWKVDRYTGKNYTIKRVSAGDVAGSLNNTGYYRAMIMGRDYSCHRIIYEVHFGCIPDGMQIDHVDGCRGNNRVCNLRVVTPAGNSRNRKKCLNNKAGTTGVSVNMKHGCSYWRAQWDNYGKTKTKSFSVLKHGEAEAFRLACDHRTKMIEELNAQGAGYTERHGEVLLENSSH